MSFRRFVYTWTGYWSFGHVYTAENPYDSYDILLVTPMTLLMLFGLLEAFRRRREGAGLLASILLLYPAVYYISHSSMRYRHVIDPMIVMLTAFGVAAVRERVRVPAKTTEEPVWEEVPMEVAEP
jgi:hypothetical protein